jgi:hypothetical protein
MGQTNSNCNEPFSEEIFNNNYIVSLIEYKQLCQTIFNHFNVQNYEIYNNVENVYKNNIASLVYNESSEKYNVDNLYRLFVTNPLMINYGINSIQEENTEHNYYAYGVSCYFTPTNKSLFEIYLINNDEMNTDLTNAKMIFSKNQIKIYNKLKEIYL